MVRRIWSLSGYVIPVALFTAAVALAARAAEPVSVPSEKPSQYIWQTQDGTYTNLPLTHGGKLEQFKPSRDRVTPVQRTAVPHNWAAAAPNLHSDSEDTAFGEDCRSVYVGSSNGRGGATEVCGRERAVVFEERVRQKGSLVTSTDTVITVDGQELMRVRGRRAQHDPGRTVKE